MLRDGELLYHGSYISIERIDLSKSSEGKDFGKGFYVTTDPEQARRFIRPSIRKAIRQGKISEQQDFGFVSVFRYQTNVQLDSYAFSTTDKLWLQFVAMNRLNGHGEFESIELLRGILEKDLILGKVANDQTNETITAYLSGAYGEMDDDRAVSFAISLLRPERLTDQLCFRTERSLANLIPVEVVRYDV